MLTRDQLAAERAASLARQAKAQAERDAAHEPNPYERTRIPFGYMPGAKRKPDSWYADLFVPPMDVTEVVW